MASMAPHLAEVANLVGDLARANILLALMDNRALTAGVGACSARLAANHQLSSRQADKCETTAGHSTRTTSLLSVGIAAGGANARNGHGGGRR